MLFVFKEEILRRLAKDYPLKDPFINQIILYGSVARDTYTPLSDIDLLLITTDKAKTRSIFSSFRSIIFNETGVILTAIYLTCEEFSKSNDLLIKTIKKEGVVLWKRKN